MSNEITNVKQVKSLVQSDAVKSRLNEILGKRGPQFATAVVQLVQQSYMLQRCEPQSILGAAMTAATLDLAIHPTLGHAYVVPYGKQAQFQIGYKGLIQLAQRTGQFRVINDIVVPNGCLKSFDAMTERLDVDWDKESEGQPDGYAVYFELVNGFRKTVYWSREKVDAHAKRFSQAYSRGKDTPWKTDFDAMALKTVLKYALGKYAPLSVEMQKAVTTDQAVVDISGEVAYPDNPDGKTDERPDPVKPPEKEQGAAYPEDKDDSKKTPGNSEDDGIPM